MIVPILAYDSISNVYHRGGKENGWNLIAGQYAMPEIGMIKKLYAEEKLDGQGTQITIAPDLITYNARNGGETTNGITTYLDSLISPSLIEHKFPYVYDKSKPSYVKLYGEAIGYKIQDGEGYFLEEIQKFVLFDVFVGDPTNKDTPIGGWWLRRSAVEDIAKSLGIMKAPTIDTHMTIGEAIGMVREGFTTKIPAMGDEPATRTKEAEGIILRTDPYLFTSKGKRIMCKVKTKDMRRLHTGTEGTTLFERT